eukprot:2025421-Amphidinium_carterae.1
MPLPLGSPQHAELKRERTRATRSLRTEHGAFCMLGEVCLSDAEVDLHMDKLWTAGEGLLEKC